MFRLNQLLTELETSFDLTILLYQIERISQMERFDFSASLIRLLIESSHQLLTSRETYHVSTSWTTCTRI